MCCCVCGFCFVELKSSCGLCCCVCVFCVVELFSSCECCCRLLNVTDVVVSVVVVGTAVMVGLLIKGVSRSP